MATETQSPSSAPRSRGAMLAALFVAIALAAAALYILFDQIVNRPLNMVNTGAAIVDAGAVFTGGTAVDPPRMLDDFTLTSNKDVPISLSDLRGKAALIYFGYTHCPDFCPLTMRDFKQIKAALGDQARDVAFVLVSVDGERDTPQALDAYLSRFDPTFIGMTGNPDDVERIGADYELYAEKLAGGSAENYYIDHLSSVFMVDPQGRLVMVYMHGTEPDVIVEDIQRVLRG